MRKWMEDQQGHGHEGCSACGACRNCLWADDAYFEDRFLMSTCWCYHDGKPPEVRDGTGSCRFYADEEEEFLS